MYDDRVEMTSPGMLFGSLRLQDIREGISIPRNRALVYALTYMNIMEHWGSGIPRINKKIIRYIEEKGSITNREVQNLLNIKDSRALKILREMVEAGILKKEGKLKGSNYKLK